MSEISCDIEVGDRFLSRDGHAFAVVSHVTPRHIAMSWRDSDLPHWVTSTQWYAPHALDFDLREGLLVPCERDFL